MGTRSFETYDSKTKIGATLTIKGETAPDEATLDNLLNRLRGQIEREIAGIEEEEAPEISDSMSQKEFEAARQRMENLKRKKREPDLRDVRLILSTEKKRKIRRA